MRQTGVRFLQVIYYNWLLLLTRLYENMVLLCVACPCDYTLLVGVFSTFGVRTVYAPNKAGYCTGLQSASFTGSILPVHSL